MAAALRIFISYRRGDSSGHSGRLYDSLKAGLPESEIFMDVDAIGPGEDFERVVTDSVASCDVLLAVIGPGWLGADDSSGARRLERDDDLVRIEIETALKRGVRVIPVLVDEAAPPAAADLPPSIAALSGRNAVALPNVRWRSAVEELIETLANVTPGVHGGAEQEQRAARKHVSVVHLRMLLDSHRDAELDPEYELALMTRLREEVVAIAETYGGHTEVASPRSLRVLFGATVTHEDDALRAAQAAAELGDASSAVESADDVEATFAIGIASGDMIVHLGALDGSATGSALGLAERLADQASAGEILLDTATSRLLGDRARIEPAAGDGAVRLEAVAPPATPLASRSSIHDVGRATEREMLDWSLRRAATERSPQVVTVLGQAGIGKSSLVGNALGDLKKTGGCLIGRCLPYGRDITFWPLVEMIKQAAAIEEDDDAQRAKAKIGRLLSDVDQGDLVLERIAAIAGLQEGIGTPEEAFWAVRRLVASIAEERATALVFEDLHWAGSMLCDLIEDLGASLRDRPVLIVCVARPELLEQHPSWGGGRQNSSTIRLDALPADAAGELLSSLAAGGTIDAATRGQILAAAQGNPLFIEQMVALLEDEAAEREPTSRSPGKVTIPRSIQSLLAARVDSLSETQRHVICDASVIGVTFYRDALETIAEPRVRGEIRGSLDALERKTLLEPKGTTFADDDTFGFAHVLLRDAAYSTLPKEARAGLHYEFAAWLTNRAESWPGEYEEIVAFHLETAYGLRSELGVVSSEDRKHAERAGEMLAEAGAKALAMGDVFSASGFLERALRLLPSGSARWIDASFELFEALLESGRGDESAAALEGIRLATPEPDELLRARLAVSQSFVDAHSGKLSHGDRAVRDVDDALSIFLGVDDHEGAARALALRADLQMDAGLFGRATADLEAAIDHAASAGDVRQEARLHSWLASALFWGPTLVPEAIRRCDEISARVADSPAGIAKTGMIAAGLAGMAGDFDRGRHLFAEAAAAHSDLGLNVALATGRQISGMIESLAGRRDAAVDELRTGFDDLRRMGQDGYATGAAVLLGRALVEAGRTKDVPPLLEYLDAQVPEADLIGCAHRELLRALTDSIAGGPVDVEAARTAAETLSGTDDLRTQGNVLLDLSVVVGPSSAEGRGYADEARRLYVRKGMVEPAALD